MHPARVHLILHHAYTWSHNIKQHSQHIRIMVDQKTSSVMKQPLKEDVTRLKPLQLRSTTTHSDHSDGCLKQGTAVPYMNNP